MIIQSLDKPLIGAALKGKEQRKGTKLRFPGPRMRESECGTLASSGRDRE